MSILSAEGFRPYRWGVLLVLLGLFAVNDVVIGVGQLIAPHAGTVDFRVYFAAAQALEHGRPLYASPPPCCFNVAAMRGYTYPPLFAFLLIPLTALPIDDAGRVWLVINYASLIALLVIGARIARPRLSLETIGWLVLMMLASASIGAAMYGIQVDPLIVLLEAVFAWSIVTDRRLVLGGVALALAACIKVSPLLIAPAILLLPPRRAIQAFAGLAAGLAAGTLTMLVISPQAVAYVTHVLPSFSGGVVSPWNRSLPGVVLRMLRSQGVHPGSGLGTVFLLVEIAALATTWFMCSRVPGASGRVLTISGLLAVVPIFQGVTWDHHLTVEILVLVLLAPLLRAGSLAWMLAVGGVLLTGVNQQIIDASLRSHGLEPPHGIAQLSLFGAGSSIDLIGMLATLAAVLLLARLQTRAAYNPAATTSARRRTPSRRAVPLTSAELAPT
ncbi:MAG: glycosyltransferase family 87 protein [Candidatus Dormiibacterota bacterium]